METLATWELWRFSGANVRCPGPRTLDYSSRFNKRTWLGAGGWNQEPGLLGAVSHIPVPGARCLPHGPARLPRGPWGQGSQPGRGPRPWARPWAGPAVIMPFAPCWAGAWKPTPGLSLPLSVWAAGMNVPQASAAPWAPTMPDRHCQGVESSWSPTPCYAIWGAPSQPSSPMWCLAAASVLLNTGDSVSKAYFFGHWL